MYKNTFTRTIAYALLVLFALQLAPVSALEDSKFHTNAPHTYRAADINNALVALHAKYPDYTHLQTIGYSHDQRPIISLSLTKNAKKLLDDPQVYNTLKKHFLYEAGLHAREVVNPVVLVSMIETYLLALTQQTAIDGYDIGGLLEDSVLHFIPLSNPDGFDLSKFGRTSLTTAHAKSLIAKIRSNSLMYLKANARGVDLNRNFHDTYYDLKSDTWINIWSRKKNQYNASRPSLAYYFGTHPGSEPETQALMDYIESYPFKTVITFHSRGEVIFWRYWMHNEAYNALNQSLAQRIAALTGFVLTSGAPEGASSGYLGDFVANTLNVPALTIETLPVSTVYNTKNPYDYDKVFNQIHLIPLETILWDQAQSSHSFHVYSENSYIRSYTSESYAKAVAQRENGVYRTYSHEPPLHLDDFATLRTFLIQLFEVIHHPLAIKVEKDDSFPYTLELHPILLVQLLNWLIASPEESDFFDRPLTYTTAHTLFKNLYNYFELDGFSMNPRIQTNILSLEEISILIENLQEDLQDLK